MRRGQPRHGQSLLGSYTPQLGLLIERRHTELGLLAAKQEAETAATRARNRLRRMRSAALGSIPTGAIGQPSYNELGHGNECLIGPRRQLKVP